MVKVFILVASLFSLSLFALENSFGSHGYFRVQTSLQDQKERVCFKVPGAGSKYRLGNECETWGELSLFHEMNLDNGVKIHTEILPVFLGANNDKVDYLRTDGLYTEFFNLFDNTASFWIGRRWYKRYDSHMTDYFFFNMSGDGFGVNNLELSGVKLSYSFMFNEVDPAQIVEDEKVLFTSHDLRLSREQENSEFTLFLNYMQLDGRTFQNSQTIDKLDGYTIGLTYKDKSLFQKLFEMQGSSTTGIFYGRSLAKGAGSYSPYLQEPLVESLIDQGSSIESSKTWRFINYNDLQNSVWGLMSNLVYELKDDSSFSATKQEWLSLGVRPYWFYHKNVRVLFELGYDTLKDELQSKRYSLTKATPAIEFALDKGIWERPVLRLFYTYARWNEDAKGQIGTAYYANKTSGSNLGVQLEYWW